MRTTRAKAFLLAMTALSRPLEPVRVPWTTSTLDPLPEPKPPRRDRGEKNRSLDERKERRRKRKQRRAR